MLASADGFDLAARRGSAGPDWPRDWTSTSCWANLMHAISTEGEGSLLQMDVIRSLREVRVDHSEESFGLRETAEKTRG
jgi:hypothetical protein